MDCQICCITQLTLIECKNDQCNLKVCKDCIEEYILQGIHEAHCMNCRTKWSNKTIVENTSFDFYKNKYLKKRLDILYSLEKSKLQDSMPSVELLLHERELEKKKIQLIEQKNKLLNKIPIVNIKECHKINLKDSYHIQHFKKNIEKYMNYINHDIHTQLDNINDSLTIPNKKTKIKNENVFIYIGRCTKKNCNGYIKKNNNQCSICKTHYCPECCEKLVENHECNKDTIKTIQLLKKDTKCCPKCAVPIHKIEGCNQMFCTQCNVVYDWKTGNQVLSSIHNPHALEYQRKHGTIQRNIFDIQCGGNVDFLYITRRFHNMCGISRFNTIFEYKIKSQYQRFFNELCDVESINKYLNIHEYQEKYNRLTEEYRIKYLMNEITEKQWINRLSKTNNSYIRSQKINEVIELLRIIGIERFRHLYETILEIIEKINNAWNKANKTYYPPIKDSVLFQMYYEKRHAMLDTKCCYPHCKFDIFDPLWNTCENHMEYSFKRDTSQEEIELKKYYKELEKVEKYHIMIEKQEKEKENHTVYVNQQLDVIKQHIDNFSIEMDKIRLYVNEVLENELIYIGCGNLWLLNHAYYWKKKTLSANQIKNIAKNNGCVRK